MGPTRIEYSSRAPTALVPIGSPVLSGLEGPTATMPSTEVFPAVRSRSLWWLWPHLLSLDAPLVALAWQDWWHRVSAVPLSACERAILGLGVWMIYLADRVADTTRGIPDESKTARHGFAAAWRAPLLTLIALIATGLVLLVPWSLRIGQFCGGLLFLAAAGLYFWLIHRCGSQRWTAWLPKEAVVGGMFALGTAFFVLCHRAVPPWQLMTAVALFGIVCFLNCALITSWERNASDLRDPYSFLNAFPRLATHRLRPVCWMLAGAAGGSGLAMHTWDLLPVALAALFLGVLDWLQHRISPDALRVLADAVLLTPWICCGAVAKISYFYR